MTPSLEKQFNILDYALSSLWRRKLKALTVLLVFAAVIFLIASFHLLSQALSEKSRLLLARTPEITVQQMSAGRQEAINLASMEKLKGIFGVRRVAPRVWGYYFDEVHLANYTVMGLDFARMPEGSLPAPVKGEIAEAVGQGGVVAGASVVKSLGLAERGIFSLFRPDLTLKAFTVKGEFPPESEIITHDLLVMDIEDARDLFFIPADKASDLCVFVANQGEIGTIARKIADALPGTRVLTRPQIQKTYQVVFGWRSGFGSICLLTALAAFTILAWDKASGLSPEERRETAILKVLGWQTADILTLRFWESLIVSGLAFLLGITGAWLHVAYGDGFLFRPVLLGWSVLKPGLGLVPDPKLADLLLIFSFSVLPYLAATVIPAWRSATVPADSALGG